MAEWLDRETLNFFILRMFIGADTMLVYTILAYVSIYWDIHC